MEKKPANVPISCQAFFVDSLILIKAARLRTETSYRAGSTRRVSPSSRSRDQSVVQVNDELVQRSITFLSGEIQLAYLGVGLARKPEPCMRKQLGANWKSAAGIVVDHFGRRRPKGNEQVRATISSRGDTHAYHSPTRRNKPVALTVTQWLGPVPRDWFNPRRHPPDADPHVRWCGEGRPQGRPLPDFW